MSTLDRFFLEVFWNSFMNTVFIRVSVQGKGQPEKSKTAVKGAPD